LALGDVADFHTRPYLSRVLKYRLITGPLLIALLLSIILVDNWLDGVELHGMWQTFFWGNPIRLAVWRCLALRFLPQRRLAHGNWRPLPGRRALPLPQR
jgi:hypothetical protein